MVALSAIGFFEVADSALEAALQDAGRNRPQLERALAEAGELKPQVAWLITQMPHLDRLEITAEVLLEHVREANRFRGRYPDSIYAQYLLNYRIWEEPCRPWRRVLRKRFEGMKPQEIARWIKDNVALDTSKRFFGPFPSPLDVLEAKGGSPSARYALLVAALRATGWPARFVRGARRSWIEYWDATLTSPGAEVYQGKWVPLKLDEFEPVGVVVAQRSFGWVNVSGRYGEVGFLKVKVTTYGEPDTSFDKFAVLARLPSGELLPLDNMWWPSEDGEDVRLSDGSWLFELLPGQYLLSWGRRNARGEPFVRLREIEIKPGETLSVTIETGLPLEALTEAELVRREPPERWPEYIKPEGDAIYLLVDDGEASARTLKTVKAWAQKSDIEVSAVETTLEKAKEDLGARRLPVVIAFRRGKLVLWREGFQPGLRAVLNYLYRKR